MDFYKTNHLKVVCKVLAQMVKSGVRKQSVLKQSHHNWKLFNFILKDIESAFGISTDSLTEKYAHFFQNDRDISKCKYFLRNGCPCSNAANSKTGFCSNHKNCKAKYDCLENLFKNRFREQEDGVSDEIDFARLSVQNISKT